MQLDHGGRTEHAEDPRRDHVVVFERAELSTLDSAKDTAVLRADQYLGMGRELPG
jgi:hypothetical protein